MIATLGAMSAVGAVSVVVVGSVAGGGLAGAVDGWAGAGSWAFIGSGAGFLALSSDRLSF